MGAKSAMTREPLPAHFVLVHGSSFGGWCWYKIRSLLESIRQKVSCPDLCSSGTNPSSADTILTFEDYNKPLHDFLTSLPAGEKVILVGHSAGGHSVTYAIQNFPEKIQAAVYVGAVMLRNGYQTEQDRKDILPDFSKYGDVFDYGYGQGRDNPPTSVVFKKDFQRPILCQRSPIEDSTLAAMLLRPSPTRALGTAIFPEGMNTDKVPRVYIKTLHDNCVALKTQDFMINKWPPSDVYTIDSDHCAMFSNPLQFFGLLVKVAAKFGSQKMLLEETHLTKIIVRHANMSGSVRARM